MNTRGGHHSGRATLNDVAKLVGVSAKTVSRVVNGEKGVSEAKREEILAAIEQLGFRLNRAAQALKNSAPNTLILMGDRVDSLYFLQILAGALPAARRSGLNLVVQEVGPAGSTPMSRYLGDVEIDEVAAIVAFPPLCDDAELLALAASQNVPLVRISPIDPTGPGIVISVKEAEGAATAAEYLFGLGHRKVAIIQGMKSHAASRTRVVGFLDGWIEAGGNTSDVSIVRFEDLGVVAPSDNRTGGSSTPEELVDAGVAAAKKILSTGDRPTAVFCFNDAMALGVMWGAQEMGLSVPQDLSIIGFDGNIAAALVRPKLTSVKMPLRQLGESSVELAKGTREAVPELQTELIVAGTCAPPKG